jgi:DNA-binding response OmpR family regulator
MANILVVDDDVALARMLRFTLSERGYGVSVAHNGERALDAVEEQAPDVIVVDLEMPVMDGRRFYHELRSRGHAVPVLICSAYGARTASRELGANGYIDKPFDPDELVRGVERLLT